MENFKYFEEVREKIFQYREKYGNMLISVLNENNDYNIQSLEDLDLEINKLINHIVKFQYENRDKKIMKISQKQYQLLRFYLEVESIRINEVLGDVKLDRISTYLGEIKLEIENDGTKRN